MKLLEVGESDVDEEILDDCCGSLTDQTLVSVRRFSISFS